MTLTPRALLRSLLVVGLAGGLLVSPATSPTASAAPDRPQAGDCHDLTFTEAMAKSDPDPTVPCDGPHTSLTIAAPSVPADVDMNDGEALGRIYDRVCRPAYYKKTSSDIRKRLMTSYSLFYFIPTKAQIADGERWLRCDLAVAGGLRKLAPLGPVTKLGRAPYDDAIARCWTSRRQRYAVTSCAKAHAYRATGPFEMSGRAYPTQREFSQAASRRCAPNGRRVHYFTPSSDDWKAGFKWVQCADETTR